MSTFDEGTIGPAIEANVSLQKRFAGRNLDEESPSYHSSIHYRNGDFHRTTLTMIRIPVIARGRLGLGARTHCMPIKVGIAEKQGIVVGITKSRSPNRRDTTRTFCLYETKHSIRSIMAGLELTIDRTMPPRMKQD